MFPLKLWINDKEVLVPRTEPIIVQGCPGWLRRHKKEIGYDLILWSHPETSKHFYDILSNQNKNQTISFEWIDGKKEKVNLPAYTGFGFHNFFHGLASITQESMSYPYQLCNANGGPIGKYEAAKELLVPITLESLLTDFLRNGSPRALDQLLRRSFYLSCQNLDPITIASVLEPFIEALNYNSELQSTKYYFVEKVKSLYTLGHNESANN